ncbi:MAG: DUF3987 domain-containing protein [Sphingomonadaceae bacterium]|nr:DUF3987 domain-containing protein [Sphingomonadaceae bacterium]
MTVAPIRASFDSAQPGADGWLPPDMHVLNAGRVSPPKMPSDIFGVLWPIISDLAEGAGAPVDYVGVSVLAVAASLIGAKRRVQPFTTSPQWQEPCILWIALVGDPSSHKSPAIDTATAGLRPLEREFAEDHKIVLQGHETLVERAKAERVHWQEAVKAATKEGLGTPHMPDAATAPDEPVRKRAMVQDATPEALGEILSGNHNGVLHLRDELSGWLQSFERYAPGGREFWLEAYGGRPHVIDRKSLKAPLAIPYNGVCVLGGIQPEKLADTLLSVADDGLVARFLWAWPNAVPYHRPRAVADADRLERAYRRLGRLDGDAAKPTVLLLAPIASDIFEAWVAENVALIEDAASLFKGFCGKLHGAALRLALVAELLGWAAGGVEDDPTEISAASITAAINFIEGYAEPTALRVFGDAALPPAERNAAMLARHIQKNRLRQINARDVRRSSGIPTLRQPLAVDDAIEALIEANWLRSIGGGTVGRPGKDYAVNPALHGGADA